MSEDEMSIENPETIKPRDKLYWTDETRTTVTTRETPWLAGNALQALGQRTPTVRINRLSEAQGHNT